MSLTALLVFSAVALLAGWLGPRRARARLLFLGSLIGIFWLQPSTPIRNLDFWLPVASIGITIFVWAITRTRPAEDRQLTRISAALVVGAVILIGLTRYTAPICCLTASRPPDILRILAGLAIAVILIALSYRFSEQRFFVTGTIFAILALFLVQKPGALAQAASAGLRSLSGQSPELASAADLPWIGFSYLAFRWLHVLRDHQAGKLPALSLEEFVTYTLFFPAMTAGPIDRAPRFIADLRAPAAAEKPPIWSQQPALFTGLQRIVLGVFKKFVLADSLALIALNSQNAAQVNSPWWAWALLYAYTLRIYFDFAGYTDLAIGLGKLAGIHLPENFDRPYLKTNLTVFWNSWHITLAQWFRAYFFYPVTRSLRTLPKKLPTWSIILVGQMGTMLLIGLWHGITWNFVAWGAWHGLGLFVHNRWSEWARPRLAERTLSPSLNRLMQAGGWLLTFHYVTLGWVWFALPQIGTSLDIFAKLVGQ